MIFILPTDTCYGLAGELNEQDYKEIYRLKGRDFLKPLAWLVSDYSDLQKYIEITDEQIEFLRNYPHPWSILGKRNPTLILPDFIDIEKYEMISIRVASVCIPTIPQSYYPTILPFPLFLTSANLSGNPESTTLGEAREYFSGIDGYDAGACNHPPSDIFSFGIDNQPIYLRKTSS